MRVQSVSGHQTVLIFEDDAALREVMRRTLDRNGYATLHTGSAAKAVEICREYPGRIDLLLADLGMPGAAGVELAGQVTSMRAGLPVLYCSGLPRADAVGRGLVDAHAAWVQKPFTSKELVAAVREALAQPASD